MLLEEKHFHVTCLVKGLIRVSFKKLQSRSHFHSMRSRLSCLYLFFYSRKIVNGCNVKIKNHWPHSFLSLFIRSTRTIKWNGYTMCFVWLCFLFFLSSQVSRGAECVMISKKFFLSQASELTKKWIRHNVSITSFQKTVKHVNSNVARPSNQVFSFQRYSECAENALRSKCAGNKLREK